MHVSSRPKMGVFFSLVALAAIVFGTFSLYANTAKAASPAFVSLPNSVSPWIKGANLVGHHATSDTMTIALALKTRNVQGQQSLLKSLYDKNSANYHQWLKTGAFNSLFGPSSADVAAATSYLTKSGLTVVDASNPELILASGSATKVEAAFHASINDYRTATGDVYYANSSAAVIPASLSSIVSGVAGLTNFKSFQPNYKTAKGLDAAKPNAFPPYGGGPYGSGLTPSQLAGIYDANRVYKNLKVKGKGVTLAVFELAGYTRKDIRKYEDQYGLPHTTIKDVPVLGGANSHNGASEVELDIEFQLAVAPGASKLLVYNSPNTNLAADAQYLKIAQDNLADSISTSWAIPCEAAVATQDEQIQNQAFVQMGLQGQSIFSASGDAGAYGCSRAGIILGTPAGLQIGDTANNPYMTGVGGTSFRTQFGGPILFDPGTNPNPTYPGTSAEVIWNRHCSAATEADCGTFGAGGGGVSRIWGSADYIYDPTTGNPLPGVIEPGYSQQGAYCGQQPLVLCRQDPDVSAVADPRTGYSEYCTDPGDSLCSDPTYGINGWFLIGGTSAAAPLWAGFAGLADSYAKGRLGLFNYLVYPFDSAAGYASQMHDITVGDNGYYPAGAGYDMASGVGTPDVYNLVKAIAEKHF